MQPTPEQRPTGVLPGDIRRIELPTPWPVGAVNAYLLLGEPLTLIDCGPRTDMALAALEQGLRAHGHALEEIEQLLLTHQHPDHVGLAATVARRSGAGVAASAQLAQVLRNSDDQIARDLAYLSTLARRHGMTAREVRDLTRGQQSLRSYFEDVETTLVVGAGDAVEAGGRLLRVELRPGHSPTDTVFVDEADGLMVGGDHLLWGISSNPIAHAPASPCDPTIAARADRPRPLIRYLESLAATRALPLTRVLPGHGLPFSGHADLIDARMRFHRRRAQALLALIREAPVAAAQLVVRLWPELPERARFLGLSEVLGHVDLLERDGLVAEAALDDARVLIAATRKDQARSA